MRVKSILNDNWSGSNYYGMDLKYEISVLSEVQPFEDECHYFSSNTFYIIL